MGEDMSTGADAKSPDRSTCRNCSAPNRPVPIVWDEYSYVHMNGWATCETTIEGGSTSPDTDPPSTPEMAKLLGVAREVATQHGVLLVVEPTIVERATTVAEPIEWGPCA